VKGAYFEEKAVEFLKLKGYKVIERNFRTKWGEIDIVAQDKNVVSFVEVRARRIESSLLPKETVDRRKREKIRVAAKLYVQKMPNSFFRFDVVSILEADTFTLYELIKGAFDMKEYF